MPQPNNLYQKLCKPAPTKSDLKSLRKRLLELEAVVEEYSAGRGDRQTFIKARQELNDLCLLAGGARARLSKQTFSVVTSTNPDRK